MIEVRRNCYSRRRTRIYPGAAPLIGGKDLLPASMLLLFAGSRLQGSGSYNSGAGDFSLVVRAFLLALIDLRSRTLLIKVAGPWTYNLYRVLLIHGVLLWLCPSKLELRVVLGLLLLASLLLHTGLGRLVSNPAHVT